MYCRFHVLYCLQVYIADTPYRLGRGHTGDMTDLVVYNNSFISVPGG